MNTDIKSTIVLLVLQIQMFEYIQNKRMEMASALVLIHHFFIIGTKEKTFVHYFLFNFCDHHMNKPL